MGTIVTLILTHAAAFALGVFVYRNNLKKGKDIADKVDDVVDLVETKIKSKK
tara:strand:- start:6577 stop:6732 length:156 start_codon:yes stop_codon:yes gene_type:complete